MGQGESFFLGGLTARGLPGWGVRSLLLPWTGLRRTILGPVLGDEPGMGWKSALQSFRWRNWFCAMGLFMGRDPIPHPPCHRTATSVPKGVEIGRPTFWWLSGLLCGTPTASLWALRRFSLSAPLILLMVSPLFGLKSLDLSFKRVLWVPILLNQALCDVCAVKAFRGCPPPLPPDPCMSKERFSRVFQPSCTWPGPICQLEEDED